MHPDPVSTVPPLLSICIPTFSRARLLEVCLASLLPQVEEFVTEVECIVSDNASTDDTSSVVKRFQATYPFLRLSTNPTNIGIIGNITKTAVELARGDYILVIGDDDVLTEGALSRIVASIRQKNPPDLIALNVGYLPQSERPPHAQALGGVSVICTKQLRQTGRRGLVSFDEALEGPPVDFTASYSVVLKRTSWKSQFPEACTDPAFSDLKTTYPSGFVIAKTMPGKAAFIVPEPSIVIYEMPGDEFSWAKFRGLTSTLRATQLLRLLEKNGVPRSVVHPYFRYQVDHRSEELADMLWNPKSAGGWREALQFAWMLKRFPFGVLKLFVLAWNHPHAPSILAMISRGLLRLKGLVRRHV